MKQEAIQKPSRMVKYQEDIVWITTLQGATKVRSQTRASLIGAQRNVCKEVKYAYEYKYLGGGKAIVKISEEWLAELAEFDRAEKNNNRKERKHCILISAISYAEDRLVSNEPTPLQIVCGVETVMDTLMKVCRLNDHQSRLLRMRLDGMTEKEIAGLHKTTVNAISKKLKKLTRRVCNVCTYRDLQRYHMV